eukprot:scaffold1632_cov208-Ochromonas_danica.AAC.5
MSRQYDGEIHGIAVCEIISCKTALEDRVTRQSTAKTLLLSSHCRCYHHHPTFSLALPAGSGEAVLAVEAWKNSKAVAWAVAVTEAVLPRWLGMSAAVEKQWTAGVLFLSESGQAGKGEAGLTASLPHLSDKPPRPVRRQAKPKTEPTTTTTTPSASASATTATTNTAGDTSGSGSGSAGRGGRPPREKAKTSRKGDDVITSDTVKTTTKTPSGRKKTKSASHTSNESEEPSPSASSSTSPPLSSSSKPSPSSPQGQESKMMMTALSSLSSNEAMELLRLLGCSKDLQAHDSVNGVFLQQLQEVQQLRAIGENKYKDNRLKSVLKKIKPLQEEGISMEMIDVIRQRLVKKAEEDQLVLFQTIKKQLRRMAECGDVTLIKRQLEACGGGIDRIIPASDINRGYTADLIEAPWGRRKQGATVLHISASRGHHDFVKLLLQHPDIQVNQTVSLIEWTALYLACFQGHAKVVQALLSDERVDINQSELNDLSPLYTASQCGYIDVVKLLLSDARVDVNKARRLGVTPLHAASRDGHVEVVKVLLSDKRVDVNRVDVDGATAFYTSCYEGRVEVVKVLLSDKRVDVNRVDVDGATAFYKSCYKGRVEVVKLLLSDSRVDINKANKVNYCLVKTQTVYRVNLMNGWSPLFAASADVVKVLLSDRRVDVNQVDEKGMTPLIAACAVGRTEVVKVLLSSSDVDVNRKTKDGWIASANGPALDIASAIGSALDIASAIASDVMKDGFSALFVAIFLGSVDTVKVLLADNRVDVDKVGMFGMSPLFLACVMGQVEVVKVFLSDSRIDVNKCQWNGIPVVHLTGSEEIKQLLKEKTVKMEKKGFWGGGLYKIGKKKKKSSRGGVCRHLIED